MNNDEQLGVHLGCVSLKGRRLEMEDAVVTIPNFMSGADFCGVYDGHGGSQVIIFYYCISLILESKTHPGTETKLDLPTLSMTACTIAESINWWWFSQVADHCRGRLHAALLEELKKVMADTDARDSGSMDPSRWESQQAWEEASNNCFSKVDSEVRALGGVEMETVGSTAVVAVVFSSHIVVANCGDSRAVLCSGRKPMPLSLDHKPDREDEATRIEEAGGRIIHWDGVRVCGVLSMSRAIGDAYLKPWIIPVPEVTVTKRSDDDECLILASDGLWDVITNDEACEIARRCLRQCRRRNASARMGEGREVPAARVAAQYLTTLALHRGSRDNISVIVVDLKRSPTNNHGCN
ncbi:phosphatase 2C 56 protein [Nymphaea thermarum]|nr:phosphatase 2C 56 protein [Nymphaea thermarum]